MIVFFPNSGRDEMDSFFFGARSIDVGCAENRYCNYRWTTTDSQTLTLYLYISRLVPRGGDQTNNDIRTVGLVSLVRTV